MAKAAQKVTGSRTAKASSRLPRGAAAAASPKSSPTYRDQEARLAAAQPPRKGEASDAPTRRLRKRQIELLGVEEVVKLLDECWLSFGTENPQQTGDAGEVGAPSPCAPAPKADCEAGSDLDRSTALATSSIAVSAPSMCDLDRATDCLRSGVADPTGSRPHG